jgi:hypothetical protein
MFFKGGVLIAFAMFEDIMAFDFLWGLSRWRILRTAAAHRAMPVVFVAWSVPGRAKGKNEGKSKAVKQGALANGFKHWLMGERIWEGSVECLLVPEISHVALTSFSSRRPSLVVGA